MVFHPSLKRRGDLSCLISGIIMIVAASFSIKKISEGSKNVFAYVLMCFTVLLGLAYIAEVVNDAFTREVANLNLPNFYTNFTFLYL